MKGKYLITTTAWFYGPDGKQYRAVWGDVTMFDDKILGVTTNRNSSNWYAKVGTDKNHVIVAGCQIHYAVQCDNKPSTEDISELRYSDTTGKSEVVALPNAIFIAE